MVDYSKSEMPIAEPVGVYFHIAQGRVLQFTSRSGDNCAALQRTCYMHALYQNNPSGASL
ncbi:MAG: hypothetical protein ACJA04_001198 [Cellvibrionaceae bacterium]|jgi:hypothetical protein